MTDNRPLYAIPRSPEQAPKPPRTLKAKGKALWGMVVADFELEGYQLETLRLACEALDRIEQARVAIQQYGLVIEGRFGPKSNPACEIEKNNKTIYARLMRELGLDAIADSEAARPKPLYGGRRR
jgi:phage terminase small subunit